MRTASKVTGIIATIITVFAIVFCGIFVFPRIFGIKPYIVQTPSMTPIIGVGDVVFVNERIFDLQPGDIGAYAMTNPDTGEAITITHRVISVNDDGTYTFKGDANNTSDPDVNASDIVGKYVFRIPKIGLILGGHQREITIALVVLVVVVNGLTSLLTHFAENKEKT